MKKNISLVATAAMLTLNLSIPLNLTTLAYADNIPIGTATNAIGTLTIVRTDGVQQRLQGKGKVPLYEGDVLRTENNALAFIEFIEGVQVALNEDTSLKLLSRWERDKPIVRILRLKQGEVWAKTSGGPKRFEVETPVATAAIKETEFNIKVLEDGNSVLTVIEGIVQFGTAFGTCPIKPGTISYGNRGKKCTKPAATDAKAATNWTEAVRAAGK